MMKLVTIRPRRERKPSNRTPRKGVPEMIVEIGVQHPQSELELSDAVRTHDGRGDYRRSSYGQYKVHRVEVLRRQDVVLFVFVMYLVKLVQSGIGMHPSMRPVEKKLVYQRQTNEIFRGCRIGRPIVVGKGQFRTMIRYDD